MTKVTPIASTGLDRPTDPTPEMIEAGAEVILGELGGVEAFFSGLMAHLPLVRRHGLTKCQP